VRDLHIPEAMVDAYLDSYATTRRVKGGVTVHTAAERQREVVCDALAAALRAGGFTIEWRADIHDGEEPDCIEGYGDRAAAEDALRTVFWGNPPADRSRVGSRLVGPWEMVEEEA
jgi:hypothetical protein